LKSKFKLKISHTLQFPVGFILQINQNPHLQFLTSMSPVRESVAFLPWVAKVFPVRCLWQCTLGKIEFRAVTWRWFWVDKMMKGGDKGGTGGL